MIEICPTRLCTGCGACVGACPKSAISFHPNPHGVIYPIIEEAQCINCHICKAICPNNTKPFFFSPKTCYASWYLDQTQRDSSSSGGMAYAFGEAILKQGGVVYGAAVSGPGKVEHIRVDNIDDLEKLQKSKYVQSYLSHRIYKNIIEDKKNKRLILFIGTPCQVAGITSVINDYEKFYSVDLICHGVPSQKILQDHIKMVLHTNKLDKDIFFSTRSSKNFSLKLFRSSEESPPHTLYIKDFPHDAYMYGFMYALFYRPNCYECQYATPCRVSDITIGDFWGLGETTYSKDKVSVTLVNTEKGEKLLSLIENKCFLERRKLDEAIHGNGNLQHPSKKHLCYSLFHFLYPKFGYKIAIAFSMLPFRMLCFFNSLCIKNHKI